VTPRRPTHPSGVDRFLDEVGCVTVPLVGALTPGSRRDGKQVWRVAAGVFQVALSDLHTGATRLGVDGDDVVRAGAAGVAAAQLGAAASAGPLSAALARLGAQITSFTAVMAGATKEAGTTLAANAARYEADDAAAQARLNATIPTGSALESGGR
jgi:hypothetical protein